VIAAVAEAQGGTAGSGGEAVLLQSPCRIPDLRRIIMPWPPFRWPVEKANWKLSNAAIAKQFGISTTSVVNARRRLNKPAVQKYDWVSVDWTKTNPEIAKKLGCSSTTVSGKRQATGMPKVKALRSSPIGDRTRQRILKLLAKGTKYVTQLDKTNGVTQPIISRFLKPLREQGLVKRRRKGHCVFYTLTAKGRNRLRKGR
jgi:DNA-binding transcriptional ArsR family regulator/DNA-binding CsgD family transcriptional regulator